MMPAADNSKPLIIIITYLIALGHFPHVIAEAVESCFLVITDAIPWSGLAHFVLPMLLGNTIGGVLLVAFFNHAQVITE
jgi:formate/nitrite transporter FocA (FNT family)